MIIDFSTQADQSYDADLCIIGAGIATYTLLSSLSDSPMRILVVERGGLEPGPAQEQEKQCMISGHAFTGHQEGRYFGLGGTSEYWGGQALPLSQFDISKKNWVPYSGWPIGMDDIEPFYPDAEKLFQVDPKNYSTDVFEWRSMDALSWDQASLDFHYSKWSPRPNFKPNLIEQYSTHPRITILINAVTHKMDYDAQTQDISRIQIQVGEMKGTVTARKFVLAAGGIENARLLLVSESLPPNQWIGRMFQDHPTAQVATVHPTNMHLFQRYFNYFFIGRTRCLPRISLTQSVQEQKKILAATSFIQFLPREGSVFESLKQIYRAVSRFQIPSRKVVVDQLVSLRKMGEVIPIAKAFIFGRYAYVPDSTPRLTLMVEQEPSAKSYIGLSDKLDINGMPLPNIHWDISDATIDTIRVFSALLQTEFSRLQMGSIEWDSWMKGDNESIRGHLIDAYHHMGTTRMSHSKDTGVVDSNCRMHDVHNLYIAGSSVFPTSGHSNPTLTFMALALRLGQHLKTQTAA